MCNSRRGLSTSSMREQAERCVLLLDDGFRLQRHANLADLSSGSLSSSCSGPRLCLGMNLANFEAVSFTAATLQKYDFTWTTPEQGQTGDWPPKYAESLTHPMKRPYECIVTARKS